MHGYDVVDHGNINPELGGETGFRRMADALRRHGVGLIVDIVPNHMAVGNADNPWWLDLLARGRESAYAKAFDIDWDAPGLEGKILAPFLDGAPEKLLASGELKLAYDPALKTWCFAYYQHRFPLRPEDQGASYKDAAILLGHQHFLLADWRDADARINWRRFFDVTDLAAIRIAEPGIFEAVHRKIFDLYGEGLIDGVRVDHVDGIADPAAYCRQLRESLETMRSGAWIVVEKILAEGELLPADWAVDGTTGYDFMNEISVLQHGQDGGTLEAIWQAHNSRKHSYENEECVARLEILHSKFAAQLSSTQGAFEKALPDIDPDHLKDALVRALVALRCYRSYATGKENSPGAGPFLDQILRLVKNSALTMLFERQDDDPAVVDAIRRFAQLCAPLAAKAVEDTVFYRYGRLLSRNDVGFDPRIHTLDLAVFHARMAARAKHWPRAMLTTATHDHKRGEDARARLAVISELPERWRRFIEASPFPDAFAREDLYQLYQTLVGAWPNSDADQTFAIRIEGWCRKFLREAKLRSSWQAPNQAYENLFCGFACDLVLDGRFEAFRLNLASFLSDISPAAEANCLVQAVLRNVLPGIPDLYQGCEWQDLSMVDPDNRRPVDFDARAASLSAAPPRKQALIASILRARRENPRLWATGDYRPIVVKGAPDLLAFARTDGISHLLVLARLHTAARPFRLKHFPLDRHYRNLLTKERLDMGAHDANVLFGGHPAAVLLAGGID